MEKRNNGNEDFNPKLELLLTISLLLYIMMIFVTAFLDTFGQDYKWISAVMMGVLGVGFVVTRILAFRKKKG